MLPFKGKCMHIRVLFKGFFMTMSVGIKPFVHCLDS